MVGGVVAVRPGTGFALSPCVRWIRVCTAVLLSGAVGTANGCADRRAAAELRGTLERVLAAKPLAGVNASVGKDARSVYAGRQGGDLIWVRPGSIRARAATAVTTLQNAPAQHGLSGDGYKIDEIVALQRAIEKDSGDASSRTQQLAEFEGRLTTALLALGHDVALGRTRPEALDPRWKARRTAPDFVGTFERAANGDPAGWLASLQPKHGEYAALQKALAGAAPDRARQIAENLERWRWLPDDFGDRYFLVNIPSYRLLAREHGKTVLDIRVVVGKPGNETPAFSADMTTVVFSPYWNIPDTIVVGETAPAVAKDPGYLAKHDIEILRVSKSGAQAVDPSRVDWNDPDELRQLAFRQRPGAQNALGHVKFVLPNRFDVYLHDTPADALFARAGRAFSHGCVRVEEPEALAKYVLRDQPDWDGPRIVQAMQAGVEKQVKLQATIAVHIVYFTAWADDAGNVVFLPDVYKYDARQ